MSIYTRFGTPCTITAAYQQTTFGAIPVDVICHDADGKNRAFKTYSFELRADDGLAEIVAAMDLVRVCAPAVEKAGERR